MKPLSERIAHWTKNKKSGEVVPMCVDELKAWAKESQKYEGFVDGIASGDTVRVHNFDSLEEAESIKLTKDESEALADLIDAEAEPNDKAVAAIKKHLADDDLSAADEIPSV